MKRSNFVWGLGLSIVLHASLLYLLLGGVHATPSPPPTPPVVTPIQIASIDPHDKLSIEPVEVEPTPMVTKAQTTDRPLETPVPRGCRRLFSALRGFSRSSTTTRNADGATTI